MEVQVRYGYLDCYLFMSMCNSVGIYIYELYLYVLCVVGIVGGGFDQIYVDDFFFYLGKMF